MTPLRSKFKQLLATGMTYALIAGAIGVTPACLYKWRIELGLPARKRGPKPL